MAKKSKLPVEKLTASKVVIKTNSVETSPKTVKLNDDYEKRYQAEDALRTLQRAAEIKRDPALVKAAKNLAKEQIKSLSKVGK